MKKKLLLVFLVVIGSFLALNRAKNVSATLCIPPPLPVDIYLQCKNGNCDSRFYTYTYSKVCSKYVWLQLKEDDEYDVYINSIYKSLNIKKDGIYLLSVNKCLDNRANESCLTNRDLKLLNPDSSEVELANIKNTLLVRSEEEHQKAENDRKRDIKIQITGITTRWLVFSLVPFLLTVYLAVKKNLKVLTIFAIIAYPVQVYVEAIGSICIDCDGEVLNIMSYFYRLWILSFYGQVLVILLAILYKLAKKIFKF